MDGLTTYSLLEDYWVAVLGATESEVIVGDALSGLTQIPYDEFGKRWHYLGIVLGRR